MKVVVDTNVLVSGILSREGPPGKIVDLITDNHLQVCFVGRVLAEYESVLNRPEFTLPRPLVANLLAQIVAVGESVSVLPLPRPLPHTTDEMFLETALAGGAECLITGNLRHFPPSFRQALISIKIKGYQDQSCQPLDFLKKAGQGMRVLSPKEFLEFYADQQAGGSGKVKSPSSAEYKLLKSRKKKRSRS